MDNYTRGSWEIQPRSDTRDAVRIIVRRGYQIHEVAEVHTPDASPEGFENSRLISAAPELLEVCREALVYLQQVADHPRLEQQLQDAIGAAERGRS